MKSLWKICASLSALVIGLATAHAQLSADELKAAEAGALQVVPAKERPGLALFYSWQRPGQPPLPFNLSSGLDVYELGAGRYLSDDRLIDYAAAARSQSSASLMSAGGFGVENAMSTAAYGCALWLEIARVTNSASNVVVTLHNTVPGKDYKLWTKQQLVATQAWTLETNFAGASNQTFTAVNVAMAGRSNLFFLVQCL